MLERFYDPTEGEVHIDGNDLKMWNLRKYRQQIGYVSQEPVLFNMSVKKNILCSKPDATDVEIIEALQLANIHKFVWNHKDKLDLQVG